MMSQRKSRNVAALMSAAVLMLATGAVAPPAAMAQAPTTQLITSGPLLAPKPGGVGGVEITGANATWAEKSIRLEATSADSDATITVVPGANATWDVSGHEALEVPLFNDSGRPIVVRASISNEGAAALRDTAMSATELMPGERRTLRLRIVRRPEDPTYAPFKPFMMYFRNIAVRDNTVDASAVAKLTIRVTGLEQGRAVEVGTVTRSGTSTPGPVPFFPFVDEFGQYIHSDWYGKVYTDADFSTLREQERREKANWPGSPERNKWGGWKDGPTLEATGFFRVTKHEGKWWFVDPEGKLFWSYGPTGVGYGGDITPVNDREHWFRSLPPREGPGSEFYRKGSGATYMYYNKRDWLGFDVALQNLIRKYGPDYRKIIPEISHDRMRSWGFNTIANWSSPDIYLQRKTPYTVAIHYGGPTIHYRWQDIYHPNWETEVRNAMERQRGTTAGDPWNLGYFVDNERWWGWRPRAAAIGEEVLKNPPERHAKIAFVELLKKKYANDIAALSAAWGLQLDSWDALLARREAPDMKNPKVLEDCGDFGMQWTERYFSTVRRIVKDVAPNNLYLGVRFHGHVDASVLALSYKYTDVISYNIYDNPPDGRVNNYRSIDAPFLCGEWGIGSDPQQTPFRGEKPVQDLELRQKDLIRYVEHAVRNPKMVGAHFFQYRDQPLTGRPDGEGTLRGFVNIVDTPNFNLVQSNRRVAYDMYTKRAAAPGMRPTTQPSGQ